MRTRTYNIEGDTGRTYHNPKSRPDLPLHNQCASDWGRCTFRSIYRNCSRFGTYTKSKYETSHEQIRPRLDNPFPNGSHCCNKTGNEDGTTSGKEAIERLSEPTSKNSTCEIRRRNYKALDMIHFALASKVLDRNAQLLSPLSVSARVILKAGSYIWVYWKSTIVGCFVHALGSCRKRTHYCGLSDANLCMGPC